jgi:hypothetical protein
MEMPKRMTWLCCAVVVAVAGGSFVSVASAGEILTLTHTDSYAFTSSNFNAAPLGGVTGQFMLPKFDPDLGDLQKVEITMSMDSVGLSQIRIDSENPDFGYGQILMAGGYLSAQFPYIGPDTAWTTTQQGVLLYGSKSHVELGVDDDVNPNFTGPDSALHSGPQYVSKSDGATINPQPGHVGPVNSNPAFFEYVQWPDESLNIRDTWFAAASATVSPYYDDVARQLTNGDVDISATVTYTYEVPEPGTLSLLALGGLAMLRRRRKA